MSEKLGLTAEEILVLSKGVFKTPFEFSPTFIHKVQNRGFPFSFLTSTITSTLVPFL